MTYYCHLSSPTSIGDTNLQLYSLEKAAECWNDLVEVIRNNGKDEVDHYTERLAFIISTLGLSLSQLIGQNCPSPEKEKMDQPGEMFSSLVNRACTDRTTRRRLNSTFRDLLTYYAAIRHFGKNKNNTNYHTVDRLTLEKLNRFLHMTIEIWDLVIAMYRHDENFLGELSSVSELIYFKEMPEQELQGNV
ncbi:MAG: hypothetical protein WC405_11615 [Syntrophales bacterium]